MSNYDKCRLCLEETKNNTEIFKKDFPKMIELLTGIKVDPSDGLPRTSCLKCEKEVKSAMLTRYQIIKSNEILLKEITLSQGENLHNSNVVVRNSPFSASKLSGFLKDNVSQESQNCTSLNSPNHTCSELNNFISESLSITAESISYYESTNSCSNFDNTNLNILDSKQIIQPLPVKQSEKNEEEFQRLIKSLQGNNQTEKIYFVRKKSAKTKCQVKFKKKGSEMSNSPKINYDIKPEHLEYLHTLGKKDRVPCPICEKVMYGMNMKNHLITHNYEPVICDTCGKTSKNAQALQDHINYYHKTRPDSYMCDKCGKGYRVRFMLARHEMKEHGGTQDYECTTCGKRFYEKMYLKRHVNATHKKIKPYKCVHCGKDFGRRTQFVLHQRIHSDETPYFCQVCDKRFKIKLSLKTHLKGVHGIKEENTVFCNICDRGFASDHALRAHLNSRIHETQKCQYCSEMFTGEYMSNHLKEVHGSRVENT